MIIRLAGIGVLVGEYYWHEAVDTGWQLWPQAFVVIIAIGMIFGRSNNL